MQAVAFEIGGRAIHWYGLLFAGGFLAATVHWSLLARRNNWVSSIGLDLGLVVMLSSVLGARVAYVLSRLDYFLEHPAHIIRVDFGGLVYYGGFIGATLGVAALALYRRIPLTQMADFTITGVPLGHAIGRIGCHLQGCCYGAETTWWWGITMDWVKRHPTQLLETFLNLIVYILLLRAFFYRHRDGRVFALYLMMYPVVRFSLEFLRGDPRMSGLFLNVAQELSLLFFALGVLLWFTLPKRRYTYARV
jgi:phosphatidylglycerol---prolipoprotein diacylglyceryl transferase